MNDGKSKPGGGNGRYKGEREPGVFKDQAGVSWG